MTGYHISLGYSAVSQLDRDHRWKRLKQKTREICNNPQSIIAEARRLGAPEACSDGCCELENFADNYSEPYSAYGHPITIIDDTDDRQIMQLASSAPTMKYHIRRAFVRLLIEAMHKEEIEVSVIVT